MGKVFGGNVHTAQVTVAYPDLGADLGTAIKEAKAAGADYVVFNYRLVRITPGALLPGSMTIKTFVNNREPGWEHA